MFRKKGKVEAIDNEADGMVLVTIHVDRLNRKEREVRIKVFERGRGEVVLQADYLTTQSEIYAFYSAQDIVKQFIRENDLVLDTETTNVDLPTVQTLKTKRSR
ncbi:hypothetical protein [Halobacillus mangrovi]|uniref:Uncharacterized protein n=1 Tax=Halobacillus mangrovi TaxID=402384 RepID=A0A1W5ZY94_9BACI|nr:hypothetical protein [Halobacillus mangrovi]ARI78233.1 hypothetical protein HM131_15850 [Halobacillus mangrovi]